MMSSVGVADGVGVSEGVEDGLAVQVGGNTGVLVAVAVSVGLRSKRATSAISSRSRYASEIKYTGIATAITKMMAINDCLPRPRRYRIFPQLACVQIIQQRSERLCNYVQ